jgi:5'-phosphate synthase pdxT subunit
VVEVRVGVLALQGDFAEHLEALDRCGVSGKEVRTAQDLGNVDALIIPGGESTTILKLLDRFDLRDPVGKRIEAGMPVFATCAGAIVLANQVSDGEPPLGLLEIAVRRNAYGRQRESFEAGIEVEGLEGGPVRAVFIRAPIFEQAGKDVHVLATWAGHPVVVRSGAILATAFHPELTEDQRMHRYFLEEVAGFAGLKPGDTERPETADLSKTGSI